MSQSSDRFRSPREDTRRPLSVTVPINPDDHESHQLYLERELKRYFTNAVVGFEEDESIVAVVSFGPQDRHTLVCRPGSDDDWYVFTEVTP